jgi:hypothetical protein
MDESFNFQPDRRRGRLFHQAALVVFSLVGMVGLWQAAQATIGPVFLMYLLPALAALGAVPALAYRYYDLLNSSYTLEREGVRLRWGLRLEVIPIEEVLWVRPASELGRALPLPRLRWPGALVGSRSLPGAGEVEFMAAQAQGLVVIATPGRGYAVSPSDPQAFLLAFQRCMEMGSLFPLEARSVYPTYLLSRVWRSRLARLQLLLGAGLSLALLVWVSLAIPGRSQIHLGFSPSGMSGDLAPAVRLLLLPVLNTFFFLSDLLLGLFLYRREESQTYAYLLWGSGALTALLFLFAAGFILGAG